jgi:acyl-coenzyme A thioesterase PaaI-like protein
VNFLSPAKGTRLVARGRVIRKGKTLAVCAADVFTLADRKEKLVATMLATIMVVRK